MRGIIIGLLSATLLFANPSQGTGIDTLQQARDLFQDGRLAARLGTPILLMVSREECSYCDLMRREILLPMERSGEYRQRVLIRELHIDAGDVVIDFQGQQQSASAFASGYGVRLTPTLLFLDSRGKELTERMLGINTIELFGLYLDASIDKAQTRMRRP